jgi:hypothetical protein
MGSYGANLAVIFKSQLHQYEYTPNKMTQQVYLSPFQRERSDRGEGVGLEDTMRIQAKAYEK